VSTQLLNVKRLGANWKSAFQVKTAPFQNKPFISFVPPIQRKLQQIVGHVSAALDLSRLQEKGNKQEGEERTSRGEEANTERTEHRGTERTGGQRERKGKKTDTNEERIQRK